MLVQLFYAWRIRRLTRNNWIVSAVVVTSLVGGCMFPEIIPIWYSLIGVYYATLPSFPLMGISIWDRNCNWCCYAARLCKAPAAQSILSFLHDQFCRLLTGAVDILQVIVCLWLVGAAVCDIIITASLTLHLVRVRLIGQLIIHLIMNLISENIALDMPEPIP